MSTESLNGRVVVITGAAGGVGRAVTLRWLAAGASVLAAEANKSHVDSLRTVVAAVDPEHARRLACAVVDVTSEAGAREMFDDAEKAFGKPADTLIHLVGGFGMAPFESPESAAVWDKMIGLNLTASYWAFRAALPALRSAGGGWIVGMASRAATAPPAEMAGYAASKAGLIALAQSVSAEVRAEDIHVNIIVASTIDTPANRASMGDEAAANWVTGDDIADATLYLCSAQARAVHGATLEVFGKV